jgi:hypothetical protein
MKKTLLALILTISVTLIPTKKADAGVILMAGTLGSETSVLITIAGAALMIEGIAGPITCRGNLKCILSSPFTAVAGLLYFTLDNEVEEFENQFETIPSYIFDEIEQMAIMKEDQAIEHQEGIKEVVFTNDEVDSVFELLDERVDQAEVANLRELLLEPVSI